MKKINDNYSLDSNLRLKNTPFIEKNKTTNINILLNRIKIEEKNNLKKKIYLTFLMFLVIGIFSVIIIFI
tara:strand:+ start:1250 stop:1459 length:210 start_codon:yes stop_codon:yes gene_type:complete